MQAFLTFVPICFGLLLSVLSAKKAQHSVITHLRTTIATCSDDELMRIIISNMFVGVMYENSEYLGSECTGTKILGICLKVCKSNSAAVWSARIISQELSSVVLTYIHTCRSYVHMPRDFTNDASLAWRLRRRVSTVMFTCGWAWPARWPIRPILGFWGGKVHKNGRFPALDADNPPCKMWRR